MRIALPFEHRSRITLVGSALVAIGAVSALAVAALTLVPGGESGGDNLTPDAQAADPAVKFLPVQPDAPPSRIAYDVATGILWAADFRDAGYELRGYAGDNPKALPQVISLPGGAGGEVFGNMVLDERGHIIAAYDYSLVDINPETAEIDATALSPSAYRSADSEGGDWVTDIESEGGRLYILRNGVEAVTVVDQLTGDLREIPLPEGFGTPFELASTGETAWVSTRFAVGDRPVQAGQIDLKSGAFSWLDVPVTSLGAGDGAVYGLSGEGLYRLDESPRLLAPFAELGQSVTGAWDQIVVDDSGIVWMTNRGAAASIAAYDPASGKIHEYNLPLYKVPEGSTSCGGQPDDCDVDQLRTGSLIYSIAPGPGGSLYFADAEGKRIGLIDPN